jgi:hypothetical protein
MHITGTTEVNPAKHLRRYDITSKMPTTTATETVPIHSKEADVTTHQTQWLKQSSALDKYDSFDVTPIIGREFPTASIKEWLQAPNSDELIKDLAITISERGVVYFRKQVSVATAY